MRKGDLFLNKIGTKRTLRIRKTPMKFLEHPMKKEDLENLILTVYIEDVPGIEKQRISVSFTKCAFVSRWMSGDKEGW